MLPGLLSLALAAVLVACGGPTAAVPSGVATPGENGHYQIGQKASIGTYVITVDKVLYPSDLGGAKPAPGTKFLVLDLTIQTLDTNNARLSAAAQLVIEDAQGKQYPLDADVTPTTDLTTSLLPDTIPALGSIHGEVAFQVSSDATDLRLVFNPSFVNSLIGHGHVVTIDLK